MRLEPRTQLAGRPARPPLVLLTALGRVRRRLARLAAERGVARGLLLGLALGCVALLLRDRLPLPIHPAAVVALMAVAFAAAGALLGALVALRGTASVPGAARAADRDLRLCDRLATALEIARAGARGAFDEACVIDAARTAAGVDASRVGRRTWPRETRLLPAVGLLALTLALLPPAPLDRAFDAIAAVVGSSGSGEEPRAEAPAPETRRAAELVVKEALRREVAEGPLPRGGEAMQLSAVFKDTKLSTLRPDSNAFLGTDDDRLKLLRQPGTLPDLRQHPAAGGYHLRLRRLEQMMGALGNGGISRKEFADLTDRLRRMGRERGNRGGPFDKALRDGTAAFEAGDSEGAYDSMQRALDALEGGERGAGEGTLPPSSDPEGDHWPEDMAGLPGAEGGDRDEHAGSDGEGEAGDSASRGSDAGRGGKGKKGGIGDEPPEWAARNDSFIDGTMSQGASEAYDSDVVGRSGQGRSRLPFMSVFNEYRKQVEETLVKEAVPLEAREQVRAYFRALEE